MVIQRIKRLIRNTVLPRPAANNGQPPRKVSETSKCRSRLAPFCVGDGLDIGYGGDPIVPHAICMDLPEKYAAYESHVQHLHGDATNLHWFRDGALDWVYSSHVLEDFPDTSTVLNEWLRVLRVGGRLILFLPDEQLYRPTASLKASRPMPTMSTNISAWIISNSLSTDAAHLKIIHDVNHIDIYSFELVIEKMP